MRVPIGYGKQYGGFQWMKVNN